VLKIAGCNIKRDRKIIIDKIKKDRKVHFKNFVIKDGKPIARFIQNNKDNYKSYEFLKEYARENGVEIINVVPDGVRPGVYDSITPAELIRVKGAHSNVS